MLDNVAKYQYRCNDLVESIRFAWGELK